MNYESAKEYYKTHSVCDCGDLHETEIDGLKITVSSGDNPFERFPHEQTKPCFFISVSGLSLPGIC